ncbi:TonB-dependent receptor domain-containing protein [Aquimarina aggregata]|uniref:TonB-dependent receptor domain-containing protein n=1 Tax=Aquimarina aggregata TaxID=1642818 RepID=UPI00248FA7DE|nr:TonB-dependent receptor [Aquimarina aggregata]
MRIVLFCLLILPALLFAQEDIFSFKYNNENLSDVLDDIQSNYNIKFSYNPSWIKDQAVTLLIKDASLTQILDLLEHQIYFTFTKIDNEHYILKRLKSIRICGRIQNIENHKNISNASVKNIKSGLITSMIITDEKGYFEVENISITDTLTISHLGFKDLKIPISEVQNKTCENYFLQIRDYLLNEVIIKDYLSSGVAIKNDGTIHFDLKNADVLTGQAEPDALQSVQLLPGIESPNETASGIFIRGSTPDQNLVLWDGLKVYNTDHFFGTLTNLNPAIIDDITVYRSGAKAEYGDHVAGVIDIKTDQNIPEHTQTSIGLNMLHADAALKIPIANKLGLITSARRSITDVIETPAFLRNAMKVFQNSRISTNQEEFEEDPTFSEEQTFFYEDYTAKIIYNINPKDKILSSVLYTKNKLDNLFTIDEDEDLPVIVDEARGPRVDQLQIQNFGISTTWHRKWNDYFDFSINTYHSKYKLDYFGRNFSSFILGTNVLTRKNIVNESGGLLKTNFHLGNSLVLTSGYQFKNKEIRYILDTPVFITLDHEYSIKTEHSFFNQISYNKYKNWHFDLGLRTNRYVFSKKIFLEPRFSIEKSINTNFRIKGAVEIKNQSINQIEQTSDNDLGLATGIWLPSNDTIPLVSSKQISAGVLFKKRDWILDIDAYYKESSGLSAFTVPQLTAFFDFITEGSSISRGIDVLAKKKIGSYASWIGYSYADNKATFEGLNNNQPFNTDSDITHSLTWSHLYSWRDFQFSLGWRYRTGVPYTERDETLQLIMGRINQKRLPEFHRLDFSMNYTFALSKDKSYKNCKIGGALLNVYDRENILGKQIVDITTETNIPSGGDRRSILQTTKSLGLTASFFIRFNF